ncbi:MAG: FAD-dependent oxidoreductase [Spirochaetales bacterium]|jgi:flavocytochrome c|nr:FAD-dependent oxidoreductase [Spirochaetales bacterium]
MLKNLKAFLIPVMISLLLISGCQTKGAYADGVFTGAGQGMGGRVNVTVTVRDGKIAGVEVGQHSETPGISDPAIEKIPAAIVAAQSPDVDVVTGATLTSRAIMEGVRQALAGLPAAPTAVSLPFERPDVIVVGAGIAGLTAGVKAAELGAKVLILEQTGRVGGAGNMAGGTLVGVNTLIEEENHIQDSLELLLEDFVRLGGRGNFDPALARAYGENSGRVINWLDQSLKVNFGDRKLNTGAYEAMNRTRVHLLTPPDGNVSASMARGASGLVKTLSDHLNRYVDEGKAALLMDTQVTDLIIENQVIVGVTAKDLQGQTLQFRAPSTILATGGYGGNEEMLKQYNFKNILTMVPLSANGSGFKLALSAGAELRGMDFCTTYPGGVPVSGFTLSLSANASTFKDPIWVHKNGNRFVNEPASDTKVRSDAWSNAPDNIVYLVFSGRSQNGQNAPLGRMAPDAAWSRLEELAAAGNYVYKADTLAELAQKAGIDPAGLTATVNRYNRDCAAGRDSQFGRGENLTPLNQGPFYAIYTVPFVMITSGGVRMNPQAQMLRPDGSAIAGAYLAGEIVGMGNICGRTTIGGIGNGNAAVWGFVAAEQAVLNARR